MADRLAADDSVVSRGACVCAQQAAEKALKGFLVLRDVDPPRLHDLARLAGTLPERDASRFTAIDLSELTRWAIEGRYPDDLDDATPSDAERALDLARAVIALVAEQIESHDDPAPTDAQR